MSCLGWTWAERGWVFAMAILLSATALLKLQAGLSPGSDLNGQEPVFRIPMGNWAVTAGALECGVVLVLAATRDVRLALKTIRLCFGAILGYRLLLHLAGGGFCACLGRFLQSSPWQGREGLLLGGVAAFVFLTNEALLVARRRRDSRQPEPEDALRRSPGAPNEDAVSQPMGRAPARTS